MREHKEGRRNFSNIKWIRSIHREWNVHPARLIGIVLFGFALLIGLAAIFTGAISELFFGFLTLELASIAATILIIDQLNEKREKRRLKESLIRELGARDNGITMKAIGELRANGWGFEDDETLHAADLRGANLSNSELMGVNLDKADLSGAILRDSDLWSANLVGASLRNSDLRGAILSWAKIEDANLAWSNLENTNLVGANLANADLAWANLHDADLRGVDLRAADLRGACLVGANLTGADLGGIDPGFSPFNNEALNEADLSGADLDNAVFGGARVSPSQFVNVKNLSNTLMPNGSNLEEWIIRLSESGRVDQTVLNMLTALLIDEEE